MKRLVVTLAIAATIVGCSKEAEVALSEATNDRVEFSSSGSFDVGTVDANGNATLTYDMEELTDLVACAVSEDDASGITIDHVSGVGYYLAGKGFSSGSYTTFAIELTVDNSTLSWEDNAVIFTCGTTASTQCDLDVISEQTYSCDNTGGSCGQTIIGGCGGSSYAACNWPWDIPGKTKK